MPKIALIIGGAGTGKTTHLMELMAKVLARGDIDPYQIGFVSFTKAARYTAAKRASEKFDLNPSELERCGWFRTLHSVCYRQLNVGKELITESASDREWLQQAVKDEITAVDGSEDNEGMSAPFAGRTDAELALSLWHCARNRLAPLADVWEIADRCDDRTPALAYCEQIVDDYERAKRLDHRCDFTDILGRFAGWEFGIKWHTAARPQGDVPDVPVWFCDEQQDSSALLDGVLRRLTEPSRFVYLVGDPFQAIYGWAGADPTIFQKWDASKRRVLGQSYRCPAPILNLGEDILRECSDYWDREIKPAEHEGDVDEIAWWDNWPTEIDPRESWLLVARTNFLAHKIAKRLDEHGIPWVSSRGGSRWDAPVRNKALQAMISLESGHAITIDEWKTIVKKIPSKSDGAELLKRGSKTRWAEHEGPGHDLTSLELLPEWGATEQLIHGVRSGGWRRWIDMADQYADAVAEYGYEAVMKPKVMVSTIHGAKGMEADNVLLLTTTSHQVEASQEEQAGFDEERRLAYVAVTRARKRLIIARERTQFEMEIPA